MTMESNERGLSRSDTSQVRVFPTVLRNLRFGTRLCLRYPASSTMAVVVLALGVALSSMMYTLATGVNRGGAGTELDERILYVEWETGTKSGKQMNTHDFKVFREEVESLEDFVGLEKTSFWVSEPARKVEGKAYKGIWASPALFDMVEVTPIIGSLYSDNALDPRREPEILISDALWLSYFERAESAIGSTLMLGDTRARVMGVMPADFSFPGDLDIWAATDWKRFDGAVRTRIPHIAMVARLKEGRTVEQVRAEMDTIAGGLSTQFVDTNKELTQLRVYPFRERFVSGNSLVVVTLVLIGSLPVLLLACVNVFNILIGRTANRTHELAVRSSLGARRSNIMWQVLLDGLILSGVGAALGIGLASVGLHTVTEILRGFDLPSRFVFELEGRVVIFAVSVALLSGLASSFIPAWRASRIDAFAIMKDEANSSTSIYIGWLSKVAVVSQVAFSGILLFLSIVFLMPSLFFEQIELPYPEDEVLTAGVQFWTDSQMKGADEMQRFYTEVKQSLMSEPGVDAVAMSTAAFGLVGNVFKFEFEGEDRDDQLSSDFSQVISATPDYLELYGVEPITGRMLNAFDTKDSLPVCVVNTHFVSTHCQHVDPIGMRIKLDKRKEDAKWITIVGVVPSLKPKDIGSSQDELDRSFSEVIQPFAQEPGWNATLLLRAANAETPVFRQAIRRAVEDAAPLVRVTGSILSIRERLDTVGQIFDGVSTGAKAFGGAVLAMSLIGLYSIVAFATTQRRKEFGIRMAIGSSSWGIIRNVLKPWAIMIGAGVLFSSMVLLALVSLYLHFGTMGNSSSTDWKGFAIPAVVTLGILLLSSLVAMVFPAWRATKIDPMAVIRSE